MLGDGGGKTHEFKVILSSSSTCIAQILRNICQQQVDYILTLFAGKILEWEGSFCCCVACSLESLLCRSVPLVEQSNRVKMRFTDGLARRVVLKEF